jgi:hypothetical protein
MKAYSALWPTIYVVLPVTELISLGPPFSLKLGSSLLMCELLNLVIALITESVRHLQLVELSGLGHGQTSRAQYLQQSNSFVMCTGQ